MTAPNVIAGLMLGAWLGATAVLMPEVALDGLIVGGFIGLCVALTLIFGERVRV